MNRKTICKGVRQLVVLLVFVVGFCSSVMAQNVNLDYKNTPLKTVLEKITEQTGYRFAYSNDVDPLTIMVDANVKDVNTEAFFKSFFDKIGIAYKVVGKTISLSAKEQVTEQEYQLKGKVTDENNEPIIGAFVIEKGTNNGVSTDVGGNYLLTFSNKNAVIEYTYIGMKSQIIKYNGESVLNIVMEQDQSLIDEVVVTGYQQISKERASGSFEKVSAKTLDKKISFNIINKLEGQSSGLLFENNKVSIRGIASMNASTEPLVVVDGFPIEGGINSINPNDVKSITILKDAAAASIWGARASNGVIVIESKNGMNKDKTNIEFYSTLSFVPKPDLYSLNRVSSNTLLDIEQHFVDNEWRLPSAQGAISKPPMSEGIEAMLNYKLGNITQNQRDDILNKLRGVDVRDEYAKLFLRSNLRQDYNLSISGASERNNYYASVSYGDELASMKGIKNERIISNLRLQSNLTRRITFNANVSAAIMNFKNNGAIDLSKISSYQSILNNNGEYINQPYGYEQSQKDSRVKEYALPYDWNYNAYREFINSNNSTKSVDLRMQAGLKINIIEGLDIEGRYQYEWGNTKGLKLYNEETYYVRNFVNLYATKDLNGALSFPIPKGNIREDENTYNKSFITRGQINFNKAFNGQKHQVYAIAGVEFRQTEIETNSMQKFGYDPVSLQYTPINYNYEYLPAFAYSPGKITDPTAYTFVKNRYASYYANAGYTLNNKYTVTGSARLDDSNLFGSSKKYRSVPLWSTGVSWRIDRENFMNLNFVDRLAFRATYGTGGNIDRNTSPYLIADVNTDYLTFLKYATISNPKNPELRWEKTYTANVGLDFSLWKGILSGTIEYYNRKSVDLLGNVSINSLYGFTNAFMNTAKMSNKGVDLSLSVAALNRGVRWDITNRFSYNKNRVLEVELSDNSVNGAVKYASPRVNKPLNYLYSYKWAGLSAEGKPQIYNEKGEIIDCSTAMQSIDGLQYHGSLIPRYYGSLQNELSYKGLYFSMLITYKFGYKFLAPTVDYSSLLNSSLTILNDVHSDFDKRWQQAGDENKTNVPVFPTNSNELSGYWSDYVNYGSHLVKNASHIRFKEVILSYTLPQKWFKTLGVESVNVGTQIRNIGVITFNDLGVDVENIVGSSGLGKTMPEFTFSLRVQF